MTKRKRASRLKPDDRAEAIAALRRQDDGRHDPDEALGLIKQALARPSMSILPAAAAEVRRGLVSRGKGVVVTARGFYRGDSKKGWPLKQFPDDLAPTDEQLRQVLRLERARAEREGKRERPVVKGGQASGRARSAGREKILAEARQLLAAGKPARSINGLIARRLGLTRDHVAKVRRKNPS